MFTCKVQYIDDTDPFGSASGAPQPPLTVAPLFTFNAVCPLINQLSVLHRFLQAPHKVDEHSTFCNEHKDIAILIQYCSSDKKTSENEREKGNYFEYFVKSSGFY